MLCMAEVNARTVGNGFTKDDFEIITLIGQGALGKVFYAKVKQTGADVALKMIQKGRMDSFQRNQIFSERDILQLIKHVNIIKLYGTFQDEYCLYFVLEYAGKGDLDEYLRRIEVLPHPIAKHIAAELVSALGCLRKHNVAHRDFKPGNFLIGSDGHIKLTDFNSARIVHPQQQVKYSKTDSSQTPENDAKNETHTGDALVDGGLNGKLSLVTKRCSFSNTKMSVGSGMFVGTQQYLSPEALVQGNDESVGFEADLWSFGVFLYEMFVGHVPVSDVTNIKCFDNIAIPTDIPEEARDLIQSLLVVNDSKSRIGANDIDDIKRHCYFAGIDWTTIETAEPPDMASYAQCVMQEVPSINGIASQQSLEFTPDIGGTFGELLIEEDYSELPRSTMSLHLECEGTYDDRRSFFITNQKGHECSFGSATTANCNGLYEATSPGMKSNSTTGSMFFDLLGLKSNSTTGSMFFDLLGKDYLDGCKDVNDAERHDNVNGSSDNSARSVSSNNNSSPSLAQWAEIVQWMPWRYGCYNLSKWICRNNSGTSTLTKHV